MKVQTTVGVVLNEEEFRALTKGKTIYVTDGGLTVRLLLADIGFPAMVDAIKEAVQAVGVEPPEICIIPPGDPLKL